MHSPQSKFRPRALAAFAAWTLVVAATAAIGGCGQAMPVLEDRTVTANVYGRGVGTGTGGVAGDVYSRRSSEIGSDLSRGW